jgi:hypothetical protein
LHEDITAEGYAFNQLVKSVNTGKPPDFAVICGALKCISTSTENITAALTSQPAQNPDKVYVRDLAEQANRFCH